jgi:hypothetical protein
MKNVFFLLLGLCLLWLACNYKESDLENQNSVNSQIELRSLDDSFTPFGIPFPEGTTFEIVGSDLKFKLPVPFYIVGIDAKGNFHRSGPGGDGSVTCECTEGSGCDPIKNGDDIGCIMKTGCSKCTKSSKSRIVGVNEDLLDIVILNPDNDLMITAFDEIHNKYILPKSFLSYPEIENVLTAINSAQLNLPDMSKETVFINVHGYILPIELKTNNDNVSITATGGGGGGGVSCSCDVKGSCPKESHWSGVVWCNSDKCTKCTMSAKLIDPTGETKYLSIEGGKIKIE